MGIVGFTPNDNQKEAILHAKGPLFLTAGPGSGKTRVLLWRTLNLIVFHDVKPEKEKGAKNFADMRKFMDDSGDDDSNEERIMINLEKMGQ